MEELTKRHAHAWRKLGKLHAYNFKEWIFISVVGHSADLNDIAIHQLPAVLNLNILMKMVQPRR